MAEICCGVVCENERSSSACETSGSRAARKRRMDIRKIKFVAGADTENGRKRQRLEVYPGGSFSRECDNAMEYCNEDHQVLNVQNASVTKEAMTIKEFPAVILNDAPHVILSPWTSVVVGSESFPKFGMASVCGRRRDMEDAVAIQPSFCRGEDESTNAELHYFAVYDGHGCSHVAAKCRERMHELVKEELESKEESTTWKNAMDRSFTRMDKEATTFNASSMAPSCRCEFQTPESEAVGSAAVVAVVTPDKIIVANCGDSRAVLCRNGKPIPLSDDHKPDRPDELDRIQSAGGRVIYWDCPRVQGVLAMSRAIGDNYLKPYVSCEPEVTITDRNEEDGCLILASDGLWDVVSNDTACGVAMMCLKGKGPVGSMQRSPEHDVGNENSDKACSDASMLMTKMALARRSTDNVSVVVIDLRKDV